MLSSAAKFDLVAGGGLRECLVLGLSAEPGRSWRLVENVVGKKDLVVNLRPVALAEHPALDMVTFTQPSDGERETVSWSSVDVIRRLAGYLLHAADRISP